MTAVVVAGASWCDRWLVPSQTILLVIAGQFCNITGVAVVVIVVDADSKQLSCLPLTVQWHST